MQSRPWPLRTPPWLLRCILTRSTRWAQRLHANGSRARQPRGRSRSPAGEMDPCARGCSWQGWRSGMCLWHPEGHMEPHARAVTNATLLGRSPPGQRKCPHPSPPDQRQQQLWQITGFVISSQEPARAEEPLPSPPPGTLRSPALIPAQPSPEWQFPAPGWSLLWLLSPDVR